MNIIMDTSVADPTSKMLGKKKVAITASEKVYKNVGIKILEELGLKEAVPADKMTENLLKMADSKMGIDHVVVDVKDNPIFLQTRFRDNSYANFNDFTIRYDIPDVEDYKGGPIKCEFFHLEAHAMFYGICNHKLGKDVDKVTDLDKWVFCDLRIFTSLCKQGKIVITDEELISGSGKKISNKIKDGIMYCSLRKNADARDSRFIVIDVKMANDFYKGLIKAQKGYF